MIVFDGFGLFWEDCAGSRIQGRTEGDVGRLFGDNGDVTRLARRLHRTPAVPDDGGDGRIKGAEGRGCGGKAKSLAT